MSKSGNIDPYFKLSKFLSWILRHGAIEEGIPIKDDGFMHVEYILNHPFVNGRYNKEDIIHVVDTDEKHRFGIRSNKQSFEIKANQGHSINVVKNLELLPINDTSGIKFVIHGTYWKNWNNIKSQGLLRMGRNHIHFAQNICNTSQAISGLRKNVEIYIYIDLAKALESGLKFFLSPNGVILSPGDQRGCIDAKFFLKVTKVDGTVLLF
ncbi:hypothetical protein WA026_009426 [Henosepilachna vigintioctopunctata]|uniref:2'-phosphotransferase n=1 Tax=Henosepilachna vigintioctopunctata TaxID=420089 RepID=A0AAW1U4N6_9CUCU